MRIHTILFEDCGNDFDTIRFVHDNIDGYWQEEEGMLKIIESLCEGYKSRDASNLHWAAKEPKSKYKTLQSIREDADDVIDLLPEFPKRSYQSILNSFSERGYNIPDWLAEMLIKMNDQKWEREGLSFFIPRVWCNLQRAQGQFTAHDIEAPLGTDETFEDLFLLSGFDLHTRSGTMAFNIFKKQGKFGAMLDAIPLPFNRHTGWKDCVWYCASAVMNDYRVIAGDIDYESNLRVEVAPLAAWKGYEAVLKEFNELRIWTLEKSSSAFLEASRVV
jgi:hypothetical protein